MRRRSVLRGLPAAALVLGGAGPAVGDDDVDAARAVVRRMIGHDAVVSARVHLAMPAVFPNGYSVPLSVSVDSKMTETEHVRMLTLFAPRNPIVTISEYYFVPGSGRAAVSTRIRLAQPQTVIAVAAMSDGALLMAHTRVTVDSDGCA